MFSKTSRRSRLPKRSAASQLVLSSILLLSSGSVLAVTCNEFTPAAKQVNDSIAGLENVSDHRYKHGYTYTAVDRTQGRDWTSWVPDGNGGGHYERDTYTYKVWNVPNIITTGSGGAYPGTHSGHGWAGTNNQTAVTIGGQPITTAHAANVGQTTPPCSIALDYSPISHDAGEGKTSVAAGESATLTGAGRTIYSGLDTTLEYKVLDRDINGNWVYHDNLKVARRVGSNYVDLTAEEAANLNIVLAPSGGKFKVDVEDPSLPGEYIAVEVYNDELFEFRNPFLHSKGLGTYARNINNYVGDMQYIDMKLGEADGAGATLTVNLDGLQGRKNVNNSATADNTGTVINLAAKQSELLKATNGATVEWTGQDTEWHFGKTTRGGVSSVGQNVGATINAGNRLVDVIPADQSPTGTAITLGQDLQAFQNYNRTLLTLLKEGKFNEEARIAGGSVSASSLEGVYLKYLRRAYTLPNTYHVLLKSDIDKGLRVNPNTNQQVAAGTNDATQATGKQFVLSATGADSTAKLKDGSELVVSHFRGNSDEAGAILVDSTAKGIIEAGAKLSGFGSLVVLKDGATFENSGTITAGQNHKNGEYALDRGRQHGYGINAGENTEVVNKGVINVAATETQDGDGSAGRNPLDIPNGTLTYAISADKAKSITNEGTINIGINDTKDFRDSSAGILVKADDDDVATTVVAEQGSKINIGLSADGSTHTRQVDPTYGIRVESKVELTLKEGSSIDIHSRVQNAKGIFLNGKNGTDPGTRLNDSVVKLEKGSTINVHGNNRPESHPLRTSSPNFGLSAVDAGNADITLEGLISVKGLNATGVNAEGNTTINVKKDANIIVDEGQAGSRNIGIRATSGFAEATDKAVINLEGKVILRGKGNIGVYAKDHAHVEQSTDGQVIMEREDNDSREQIGYYLYGERATLNLDRSKPLNVKTDESVMFRIDKGARFDTKGLTIDTDGDSTTAIVVSRKSDRTGAASNVDTIGGTYNLTGKDSTFIKVDGGAKADVDWRSNVNILREGTRIGISDGRGYHLTDRPDLGTTGTAGPARDNMLHTSLATDTHFDRVNTYIARSLGIINYTGSYINLNGVGSNTFRMEDGGILNVANSAKFNVNGDAIQSHRANSQKYNVVDGGRKSLALLNSVEINAINVLNARSGRIEVDSLGQGILTGAAQTSSKALSSLKLSEESVWNITDDSRLTNLVNRGAINFVGRIATLKDKTAYDRLEVAGNYHGQAGSTISVNSNWYQPNDLYTNTVVINGDAYGRTRVLAIQGIGGDVQAPTEADSGPGIERVSENVVRKYDPKSPVISVLGQDNSGGEQTFVGEAEVVNSALVAQLIKKGKHYYWTLTHTLPAKEPKVDTQPEVTVEPTPEPTPVEVPLYVRETAAYLQTQFVNREMGYDLLGKLNDRVSEQQFDCNCIAPQTWSRLSYTDGYHQGKDRFAFGSKRGLVQFGQDLSVNVNESRRVHTGLMAGYSWSNNRFYDKFSSEHGRVLDDKETLGSKSQVASLGAYRTAYFANGNYLDLAVNGAWLHNQYRTGSNQRPTQNGYSVGGSVEFGRLFPISETWYVQPQAQLLGQYLHLSDIQDNTRLTQSKDNTSLQGRLGARLTNGTFYVGANVVHDILSPKARVTMGTTGLEERYNPTTADISVGGDIGLDSERKWQLYADAKYSRALAKTHKVFTNNAPAESFGGRVGIRYSW